MRYCKTFKNGLKLIINRLEGVLSVSCGILVKTGSVNETASENGISHFIEHNLFKGTKKRTAFEISDCIDGIGAQINAFTSKELTCYYTKSTSDHIEKAMEVLSDIFFNSVFDKKELEREKGVIIEEINMSNDTPDDVCLDLLAESYYGKVGYGRSILGPAKNVRRFDKEDVLNYMGKYYTADNVCISVAGKADIDETVKLVEKLFVDNFSDAKSAGQVLQNNYDYNSLYKYKKTEQTHLSLCFPAFDISSERSAALSIADAVFGGGMSSRLFQKIREQLGLAYTVYSYPSLYKDNGIEEIYAGVSNDKRDEAIAAIIEETQRFALEGVTEKEFLRGKEQVKSAFVFGQESAASQMLLSAKYLLFLDKEFDFDKRIKEIENVTVEEVNSVAKEVFGAKNRAFATVGPHKTPLR